MLDYTNSGLDFANTVSGFLRACIGNDKTWRQPNENLALAREQGMTSWSRYTA